MMRKISQTTFKVSFMNFGHSDLFWIAIFELRIVSSWICRAINFALKERSNVTNRRTAIAALVVFVSLAAGCSSAPSRFYTLSASGGAAKMSSDVSVAVGPVSIPTVVDRPQIVVSIGPNQVRLEEFNRWALPLQNNIARAVAENLTVLLGTPRVTLFPDLTSADAEYRAIIDVQRFDSMPGEAAMLEAVWIVRRMKDGRTERGRTAVREAVQTKDYEALAAGHSRAVARLSSDIANAVRALGQ
jgi:uncharacterized lipoprotein YmbA